MTNPIEEGTIVPHVAALYRMISMGENCEAFKPVVQVPKFETNYQCSHMKHRSWTSVRSGYMGTRGASWRRIVGTTSNALRCHC